MRTRSSSNLPGESSPNPTSSNPKRRNRRCSKQPFILEESPIDMMADQRTIAELVRAPTEGYAEAIVVPPILTEQFEFKHCLINMMISDQFFGLEKGNPHDHIWEAHRWLEKEPPRSILTWEDLFDELFHEACDRYIDLLRACPHHGFSELHQLDTFYNALNPADQDSLNSAAGGNMLERRTQDLLTIIKNKSKVCNSRNKSIVSQVKSSDVNSSSSSEIAKLTHAVNQQTSAVTTAMTAILKQFQATPPPASVKAVEEICVTCGAVVNYNQGNSGYRPLGVANQIRPSIFAQLNVQNNQNRFSQPQGYNRGNNFNQDSSYQAPMQQNQVVLLSELEKIIKMNEINMKAMKTQINNVKNELRNEMKSSIQASISNQTNELKNMMASFFKMNTASTSGSGPLPSNTIANPKGKLKAITTQSGIVLDGPFVPIPPPFINPKEDERVEKTLTDPEFGLPELISTRMTLELANRTICTPTGIARDVFVPVGKFTFPADFVIVDYESDPRVPLILGRPFLQTARALIDGHREEMILHDDDEILTLNMRHGTSSYSNQPQKESINMINIFNDSCEDFLEDLFVTNHQSGNPTFFHPDLTSPKMFIDEHALDYSSPPLYDAYDDGLDEFESDNDDAYNDPFDSKGEKIKESKLLIDELDLPKSSDFLPSPEYDSFLFEDFSEVDALPSTNNEDKDFDPPLYELPFLKEVPRFETPLSFSSENEEKVFKLGNLTSKGVHSSLLSELSHQGPKTFKVIKIFKSPMEIFPCTFGEDIRILDVSCLHFYPP
nr:reverse transcriptase domain-containing protein [Tanacetum cinerariifolium]